VLASWLAAALICWSPGAGLNEDALDASHAPAAGERAADRSVWSTWTAVWRGYATGDWGHSPVFNRPVRELLAERIPVTARAVAAALALAWTLGLALALLGLRGGAWRWAPTAFSTALVSTPAALLALACAIAGWPAFVALAAALLPKIYTFTDGLFQRGWHAPQRLAAAARGLRPPRVVWAYLVRPAWPELRALAQVTLPVAFGAAIPVEVFTDTPGLGQLAWKAAAGRDVMLLMNVTLLMTAMTLAATAREARRDA